MFAPGRSEPAPRFSFSGVARRHVVGYVVAMRTLLIVGLVAVVGCATAPQTGTMEWNIIPTQSSGVSGPLVKDGELVLSGNAIRSRATYAAPLTVECELQSGQVSSNSGFYIDFVPEGASATALPQQYVGIKLCGDNTLEAWASRSNQLPHLIQKSGQILVDGLGTYKLTVEVRPGGFTARANGVLMTIDLPLPYDKFRVELRAFPPPSLWRIHGFSVR